jgi:hypothetical protein
VETPLLSSDIFNSFRKFCIFKIERQ